MERTGKNDRPLTELEGAALGVVVRDGPCTAYAVKELFRESPSEFCSGSAGSIYPLIRRLEERGLVASKRGSTGRRGHLVYRATPEGRRSFRGWLTDVDRAVGMGFDPLRTRLVFLGQLPAGARGAFRSAVDGALSGVPAPQPHDDPRLAALHEIWTEARRAAFHSAVAALDDSEFESDGTPEDG